MTTSKVSKAVTLTSEDAHKLAKAYTQLSEIYARIAETDSSAANAVGKRGASKKAARDPNEPKRPMTSYLLYSTEKRQEFREKYPEVTSQDMAAIIGNAWKNLSSTERDKYNARAKQLKDRYTVDMENYKQSDSSKKFKAAPAESSSDDEDSSEDESDSAPATPPPAPVNAKVAVKAKPKKVKASAVAPPAPAEPAPKKARKHKSDAATNGDVDITSPSKKKSKKVSK
ncbi:FACT complex subunit ssrp1 [Coemansia erecta]|uniref:FACT complex subunit ssrp1 n=1 Tax=Coemansia erecta TaxID=147472 RepID=A0A9W8CS75_9FUNG|nr:FACT complex subunit ssrp1 [Coemansia erecta]